MTDLREAPTGLRAGDDRTARRAVMADLLLARRASERLWNLHRQGRIVTFPPLTGQEASVVGVVHALDLSCDWIVPSYRELVGLAALGDEYLVQVVSYWRGHPDGGRVPDGVHCLPPQIALGAQVPHAAGLAWGLQLRGEPGVACAFIGDGATSEGDFYEGINLAGVYRVPLLVVCINNGWAISTPSGEQTAAASFAAKAEAAGITGLRVDGNDVEAVADATRDARERAVGGGGPTLLELVTYRIGAHTTADDPTRYVPSADLEAWRAQDPIDRYAEVLRHHGEWDDDTRRALEDGAEERLERIVEAALAMPVPPVDAFDHLGATRGARLEEQRRELAEQVRRASDPGDRT
jgi:pyruvate dehydrogenase E1 component alpha subunit